MLYFQEMAKHTVVSQVGASATKRSGKKTASPAAQSSYQQSLFLSLALDMTWQMAIVVIVPIVGGYLLDHHFQTTPWLTVVGFVIAGGGVFVVLNNIVHQAAQKGDMINHREKS